jgi:hypothetical protein
VISSVAEEKASSTETIDASGRPKVEVASTKDASSSNKDAFASNKDSFVSTAAYSSSIDAPSGSIDASLLRFETSRIEGKGTPHMTTNAKQTVTGRPIVTLDLPSVVSARGDLTINQAGGR